MSWYKTAGKHKKLHPDQEGWTDEFGDIQRYILDAYSVKVFINKTSKKITVSLTVGMVQLGPIIWQHFWCFDLDNESAARKTFKEVKSACSEVFKEFRLSEKPNNLIPAYLRKRVFKIDKEHMAKSNIPHINHSYNVDYESDWSSSIYGTRYEHASLYGF